MRPPVPTTVEDDLAEALETLLALLPGGRTAEGTVVPSWVILRAHEAHERYARLRSQGPPAVEVPNPDGRFLW